VPESQLPHTLRPSTQTTRDRQSLEPGLASPGVLSSRVDPPSSQTLVYARRLQGDAQLGEGTRISTSPPVNVEGAAPSAVAPVVSAKSIQTSGLQMRSIRFIVIVCFFFFWSSRSPRSFTVFITMSSEMCQFTIVTGCTFVCPLSPGIRSSSFLWRFFGGGHSVAAA
jgi:hypothetical protein